MFGFLYHVLVYLPQQVYSKTLHFFDDKSDYLLDLGLTEKNGLLGCSDESCLWEGSVESICFVSSYSFC